MSIRRQCGIASILVAIGALMPSTTHAQTPPPNGESAEDASPPLFPSGLRFGIEPFAWLMLNVSGTATATQANQSVPIDANLSDLLSAFDIGGAARFEMWKGRWGLITSGTFLKTSQSGSLDVGNVPYDVTNRLFLGDVLVGYRPLIYRLGDEGRISFELDAGAGLALVSQDLSVGPRSFSPEQGFAKAIFGGRIPARINRLWLVGARGAVAVPGPAWTALGWLEIDPLEWLGVTAGYRVEHLEFSSDDVGISMTAHGPYLGAHFRFGSGPIY